MKSLYININGENIQSSEDLVVIGKPEDAIIHKFYYELGKEILKGVIAPGITNIKKKDIVTEFESHNHNVFNSILVQWEALKQKLLGENPSGSQIINLPDEYVSWLQNNSQPAYAEIAKSLYRRGKIIEISLDKIYHRAIENIICNIEPYNYKMFVVNDNIVTDDAAITIAIKKKIEKIVFIPFEEWQDRKIITSLDGNENISQLPKEVVEFLEKMKLVVKEWEK